MRTLECLIPARDNASNWSVSFFSEVASSRTFESPFVKLRSRRRGRERGIHHFDNETNWYFANYPSVLYDLLLCGSTRELERVYLTAVAIYQFAAGKFEFIVYKGNWRLR